MELGSCRRRHRRALALAAAGFLALTWAASLAQGEPASAGAHSPNVAGTDHGPDTPTRGQGVNVSVQLRDMSGIERVTLIYCRAENYACAPSLAMTTGGNATYQATIPWNTNFFRGVRNVGYNVSIQYENGSHESSPRFNTPYTPASLPEGAGKYYFYALEGKDATSSASGSVAVVVSVGAAFALLAWLGRRR
jgi:hypothetical protein